MLSGFQIEKCCQFHFLKVSVPVTIPTTQQSKMEVITRGQGTLSRLYNKRKYRYLITYIFVDRVSRSLFQLRAYSTLNTPTHGQCCGSGSGRIRNFLQDPDPE